MSKTPYMGDVHIRGRRQPYTDMPFTSEADYEDLRQQILILGRPIWTLSRNMNNGRCEDPVAKAGVELALAGLRIAMDALKK